MLTRIGLLFPSVRSIGLFCATTKNLIMIHTVVKMYYTLGPGPLAPLDFQRKRNNACILTDPQKLKDVQRCCGLIVLFY